MKKIIILIWLSALTIISCTKQNEEINKTSIPVMLKVQAVDKDGKTVESHVTSIK